MLEVFGKQCEIALRNSETLMALLGDGVQVVYLTGTDFGTQHGLFISPTAHRKHRRHVPGHSRQQCLTPRKLRS